MKVEFGRVKSKTFLVLRLVPLAVFGVFLVLGATVSFREGAQVGGTGSIATKLLALLSTLESAETGQRGYLLTRRANYLEPYDTAMQRMPAELANVVKVLGTNPETTRLEDLVASKLHEMDDTIVRLRSGNPQAALAIVDTDAGKATMDAIRMIVQQQTSAAEAARTIYNRPLEISVIMTSLSGFGLVVSGVLSILGLAHSRRLLMASERRLQLLTAGVHDHAIYMLDEHGQIQTWNTGAEGLKGFSAAEIIGKSYEMLFSPEDRRAGVPEGLLAVARARGAIETESQRVRRDGSTFIAHITLTALFDEADKLQGYCTVARNVTAQREAETVLARDKAELEALVEERSLSLQATQRKLAHMQRIEALGQLAGGVAHDFNNVMQAVQGCAGLIELYSKDSKVRSLARATAEVVERGSAITRRLLAFSRHSDLRTESVSPKSMLTNMREILVHTLGTGINVDVEASADLPPMAVDKWQLETVLINLATNARDAMGISGHLRLVATLDDVQQGGMAGRPIGLTAGAYLKLSVIDTGCGMTPEVLAHVPEPFFTTKPVGTGTGLGLAMALGLTEQSGGGLCIESAVGKGTTIMLWFPRAEAEILQLAPAAMPKPFRESDVTQGACILLVDDDRMVRDLTAEQLQTAGYAVVAVGNGLDALAVLDGGQRVDLLASDMSMPGMDGIACIRAALARRPGLPAILITGFASNTTELAVHGAVTAEFSLLHKPVALKQLVSRIEALLKQNKVGVDSPAGRTNG